MFCVPIGIHLALHFNIEDLEGLASCGRNVDDDG